MEKINLVNDTISKQDIDSLIDWLKTYPRLTKGEKTIEFEKKWSEFIGTKYSVFVNSGSSANLMMLYALKLAKKLRNEKVVVPALSWATDLAPVMQLGMHPILVDANAQDLSVNLQELEHVFSKQKPSVLLLVSVLGLPPNMTAIKKLCKKHKVYLLEDNFESFGSAHKGKRLGSFGEMSSFSLYFGHHLSTIEGGMVCTNDKNLYNLLKMIRSHGWDRDLDKETQKKLRKQWEVDDFSALYTFYVPGFNLRSTDLQAQIGIGQLEKAEDIIKKRQQNFYYFEKLLKGRNIIWPQTNKSDFISSFCIPIIFVSDSHLSGEEKRREAIKEFQKNNIEVRPLISGSLGTQPYYVQQYGFNPKPFCSIIDTQGIYVPNHPSLSFDGIERICEIILKYS
jgi:CDP-6-deoxy-D-xylo-4-hexulose-3-dehydrase